MPNKSKHQCTNKNKINYVHVWKKFASSSDWRNILLLLCHFNVLMWFSCLKVICNMFSNTLSFLVTIKFMNSLIELGLVKLGSEYHQMFNKAHEIIHVILITFTWLILVSSLPLSNTWWLISSNLFFFFNFNLDRNRNLAILLAH